MELPSPLSDRWASATSSVSDGHGLLQPILQLISLNGLLAISIGVILWHALRRTRDLLADHPLIDISDIRVLLPVTDVPRGESALQWTRKFPAFDMLRVRVLRLTTTLVPLSPSALRDVLSTNQKDFEKPRPGRDFLSRVLGYGLILSEGDTHTRQRKHLTSSFRIQNIRALHPLMLATSRIFIENMKQENDRQPHVGVDISKWSSKVTLDIIGETLMSHSFDSLNVDAQPVHEAFSRLTEPSSALTLHFILGILLPKWFVAALPTATNRALRRDVRLIRQCCSESLSRVNEQIRAGAMDRESDILSSIIADPDASPSEIIDQMMTFLGAGHETTATSIAWITHLLTLPENSHHQEHLRHEVSQLDLTSSPPVVLETLPWLNGICEEALRLYPPVTTTARVAIRDTTIAGSPAARGSMVTLFPWAINRNPQYWKNADTFMPERWIDKRPDGSSHVNGNGGADSNYCNMTFLHGNRSCIGKSFAKAELRLIIAMLFGRFRVRRLPGDDGMVVPVGSLTNKPKNGLFVTLS